MKHGWGSVWAWCVVFGVLAQGILAAQTGGISLRSAEISGPQDLSSIPTGLRLDPADLTAAGGPALLRFKGPITAQARVQAAALGIRLSAPLGRGAFIAWLPAGGLEKTARLSGLDWAMPYHPGLRLSPEIAAITSEDPQKTIPLIIHLFAGADLPSILARLNAFSLKVAGAMPGRLAEGRMGERFGRVVLTPTPQQIVLFREAIARWPETAWVSRRPVYRLLNDDSAWVGQSGLSGGHATPVHDRGILGDGQVVGILDTGIDADMCYFRDQTLGLPPTVIGVGGSGSPDPNQRKVLVVDFLWNQDDPASPGDWDSQDHGTHVAGSVAGDDLATVGERDHGDGMAPLAKLVIQDAGYQADDCADLPGLGCPVVDLVPIFQQAYNQGARLHTNSWGDRENYTPTNIYSAGSEDADEFMWTHPDFLLLFAAGNSGPGLNTVLSPATAKNVVAVGATGHGASAGSMASFSSRGKTADGRIKPDLTIPGSSIISANNDGNINSQNCSTQSMSGTSMASPTAAGLAALVREYYEKGFYPEGTAEPANGFQPSAALIKATLIASATPMENLSAPPPSDEQGWGRILLDDALYFPGDIRRLQIEEVDSLFDESGGESEPMLIEVTDSAIPLKLVLAWTDYPSTPAAATNLVNDLDLILEDPTGTVYRGNNLFAGFSVPGGTADRLNSVEVIRIQSPATGFWSARVVAQEIQHPGQGYALVATGSLGQTTAPDDGRVNFRDSVFSCSQVIDLSLIDGNAESSSVVVQVWSESETTAENVFLYETTAGSGRFSGSIATTPGLASLSDGLLSLADGETITVEYADPDDGTGRTKLVYDVAMADCHGPQISNLHVTGVTDQRLVVQFETDEPGTGLVEWGPTPALGQSVFQAALATSHALTINQLQSCQDYFIRVSSTDRFGNTSVTGGSNPPSVHTWRIPGLYWMETFEGDTSGWILSGDWEVGPPKGLGRSSGGFHSDPLAAYNNSRVLGNDLSGKGVNAGDYEPNSNNSARSPALNATGWHNTRLVLRRWLNVDATDTATIAIVTTGSVPVYRNDGVSVQDGDWQQVSYDVSALDGRPSVGVAFGLRSDGASQAAGWTIDDVILKDATKPDYGACGGCSAQPTFPGAEAAVDDDACAATGVTVSWQPTISWGSGATGSYAVYRGTSPGFVPSPANRLASGLPGLSYHDPSPPAGTPLYYIIRAENDETCGGGPANSGLTDDNLVRVAAIEKTSVPIPGEILALQVKRAGQAHLRLSWSADPAAAEYRIYNAPTPLSEDFSLKGTTSAPTFLVLGEAANLTARFFLVRAANPCGQEGP